MKLFVVAITIASILLLTGTVDAKSAAPAGEQKIGQISYSSMIDGVSVPVQVLILVQNDSPGHAVIAAQALVAGGETTYQLRVSNDTSKSSDDTYAIYDNSWKAIKQIAVPFMGSRTPLSNNDSEPKDSEETTSDQQEVVRQIPDNQEDRVIPDDPQPPIDDTEDEGPEEPEGLPEDDVVEDEIIIDNEDLAANNRDPG